MRDEWTQMGDRCTRTGFGRWPRDSNFTIVPSVAFSRRSVPRVVISRSSAFLIPFPTLPLRALCGKIPILVRLCDLCDLCGGKKR